MREELKKRIKEVETEIEELTYREEEYRQGLEERLERLRQLYVDLTY